MVSKNEVIAIAAFATFALNLLLLIAAMFGAITSWFFIPWAISVSAVLLVVLIALVFASEVHF